MFNHSSPTDSSLDEGTVTEVDSIRKLCRVKTLSGQNLTSVFWPQPSGGASRGGDRVTPALGDRVTIENRLGFPVISGFLPRLQNMDGAYPVNIDGGETLVDTGSFSAAGAAMTFDQNAAKDMTNGDRLITSAGGGILGILRGGSILLRSSRLAEIFICKWDDLVRVVSRNWEHFTDLSSDTIKNLKGRVFRYTGYAQTFADSKIENYKFNQYFGDVALAEASKTDYENAGEPAADQRIYKEEILTEAGVTGDELYRRELRVDGAQDIVITNAEGTLFTRINMTNGNVLITSSDGAATTFTKIYHTKDEVKITYNDVNVIKINATQINLSKGGNPTINMDAAGIQAVFGDGQINMSSSSVNTTFSGHFCTVNGSGVLLG